MLLRLFGQEGVLQEWAEKHGIKLKYEKLKVYPDGIIWVNLKLFIFHFDPLFFCPLLKHPYLAKYP